MDRRVEAVQEPELELVRAFEEVLQVAEAERDVRHLVPCPRLKPPVRRHRHGGSAVSMYWFLVAKSKNGDRLRVPRRIAGGEGEVQVFLRPGDRDVEQPDLVGLSAPVTIRVGDSGLRDHMEDVEAALPRGREAVLPHRRDEHRGPLHALGLVHGRDRHCVRGRVPDVGIALRVVLRRLVDKPLHERVVLGLRRGLEVDLLEVGDRLAELAEVVEDKLAPRGGPQRPQPRRHRLLADARAPQGTAGRCAGCCRCPIARPAASSVRPPGRQRRLGRSLASKPTSAASHAAMTSSAVTSRKTYWKHATQACTSGASKSRVSPLITYGISRRLSSSTSAPASLDDRAEQHREV